ncbi:hypothetical protein ACH4VR_29085 [Streptomyces sp. NPDC020883]|uniref:hypothetical protein n=1 Tax=Streptomyces sp. NPDC020883 TaxID=3365099 RepID=UPI0037A9D8A2
MPQAHVSPPNVITGKHDVSYDTYLDQVMSRFPEDQRDRGDARTAQLMMQNLGVDTQWWSRAVDSDIVAGRGVGKRNQATLDDVVGMATEAVEQALLAGSVDPKSIDAVVLSNVSYWGSPGIISYLVQPCGLRQDVKKIELGRAACAGGATAFATAFDHVAAYPDARVLVVVAERLTTIHHGEDTAPMDLVYGRTFSDAAAASVVSGYRADDRELRKRLGRGMVITHTHEYQLPDSLGYYFSELNEKSMRFGSDKRAPKATAEIIPKVIEWMKREGIPDPEWVALHPGSAPIIRVMAKAFGIDPDVNGMARHSYRSLKGGNKGGAAVMEVLAFTCDDPPAEGAPGLLAAVGPGVNFVTCCGFFTHG